MLTLHYGFKQPETNDKGSVFWSALEFDIQQLNDHIHDGITSSKLTAASSKVSLLTVPQAGWGAPLPDGGYRQLITLPGTLLYDDIMINYKENLTGDIFFLQTVKNSTSTFFVYCNTNTLGFKAVIST